MNVDGYKRRLLEIERRLAQQATGDRVLRQVRGALQRIEQGTFGRCTVDGGPIEEKRLEAVPWTPYCLKHQQQLEAEQRTRTPTL